MRGVGIIILAAGGSIRPGNPKPSLNFHGSRLRHTAQTALASEGKSVIVVLGDNAEAAEPELDGLDVFVIRNPMWQHGMSSSIRTGLGALAIYGSDLGLPDAVLLTVCDQPRVSTRLLNHMMSVHQSTRAGIVTAESGDTLGVPALFGRTYYPNLVSLPERSNAQRVIDQYCHDVQTVPFPEGSFDLDNEEDPRSLAALA